MYIYIYIERERGRERLGKAQKESDHLLPKNIQRQIQKSKQGTDLLQTILLMDLRV